MGLSIDIGTDGSTTEFTDNAAFIPVLFSSRTQNTYRTALPERGNVFGK